MPATPKPTEARGKGWTRRWQVLRAAGVRYFHAYGSWLVSISWWRFLLISILVLILAEIFCFLPASQGSILKPDFVDQFLPIPDKGTELGIRDKASLMTGLATSRKSFAI